MRPVERQIYCAVWHIRFEFAEENSSFHDGVWSCSHNKYEERSEIFVVLQCDHAIGYWIACMNTCCAIGCSVKVKFFCEIIFYCFFSWNFYFPYERIYWVIFHPSLSSASVLLKSLSFGHDSWLSLEMDFHSNEWVAPLFNLFRNLFYWNLFFTS